MLEDALEHIKFQTIILEELSKEMIEIKEQILNKSHTDPT
jgi:hypothetical protein